MGVCRAWGLGTFALLTTMLASSCNTSSKSGSENERLPASGKSVPGVYSADYNFSQKGYEEATHRTMADGYRLSDEQIIKEMAGREIWYKSAPNGRFHTYVFSQKVNSPIDWYKVLRSDRRWQRFNIWGMINDPDCCTPGKDCDAKGITGYKNVNTYGFDYCPGDEELAKYIGRPDRDYSKADPACSNPAVNAADDLDKNARESSCHLAFGVSTGAVGFRKFPNPRFNAARWNNLGGWEGWAKREFEGSMEPPYQVAISCASCHASFEPTRPPLDMNSPKWSEISGSVGNQYIQISEILVSGARKDSLENQLFIALARPGTSDTSAVPNDVISNPGTINAIINIPQRPKFTDRVTRWHNVPSCDSSKSTCQEIKYAGGGKKYWEWQTKDMELFHILKGGEDSVGADLAVQRVYVNIGMCAEKCWMNHHTDLRTMNPHDRLFGQTPFQVNQCRRECAPWRANEDRVGDVVDFLLSARPSDFKDALKNTKKISGESPEEIDARFNEFLENRYGAGSVEKGRKIFATNCASCHSSQNFAKTDLTPTAEDFSNTDFHASVQLPSGEVIRADWMGNDKSTSAAAIGTYACRARHTNHKQSHLWEHFASETYRSKPPTLRDPRGREIKGGPGYYRNISLLNVWAYAPFMHNNAMGPEICGRPKVAPGSSVVDYSIEVHDNTHVGKQLSAATSKVCDMPFDASVESRLKLFEASMDELLTPEQQRSKKLSLSTDYTRLPLGMTLTSLGHKPQKFYLEIPPGTSMALIGSFDIKSLSADLFDSLTSFSDEAKFLKFWQSRLGDSGGSEMAAAVKQVVGVFKGVHSLAEAGEAMEGIRKRIAERQSVPVKVFLKYYAGCRTDMENGGHDIFGARQIGESDKKALKAFLLTL